MKHISRDATEHDDPILSLALRLYLYIVPTVFALLVIAFGSPEKMPGWAKSTMVLGFFGVVILLAYGAIRQIRKTTQPSENKSFGLIRGFAREAKIPFCIVVLGLVLMFLFALISNAIKQV